MMNRLLILGCDPGQSGGISSFLIGRTDINNPMGYAERQFITIATRYFKMPETLHDYKELFRSISEQAARDGAKEVVAYIEIVGPMPKQGVSSAFKFGGNYLTLQTAIAFSDFRMERVTPGKWQKAIGLQSSVSKGASTTGVIRGDGSRKKLTRAKAQELFPDIKVTHAIADALLIGEYGRRKELGLLLPDDKKQTPA